THGRIYKIQRKGTGHKLFQEDMAKRSSKELVDLLRWDNPWWYRTALRLLRERRDRSVIPELKKLALESDNEVRALRGLWGLHAVGGFTEADAEEGLKNRSAAVRLWNVRLLGESGKVSEKMLARLAALAKSDPAPEVRLQLASTAQRLREQDV